jgi:hypothetical protein
MYYKGEMAFNEAFENNLCIVNATFDKFVKVKFKSHAELFSDLADTVYGFICEALSRVLTQRKINPDSIESVNHYKVVLMDILKFSGIAAFIFDKKGKEIPEGYVPPVSNNFWDSNKYENIVFIKELPNLIKDNALSGSRFGPGFDKAAKYFYTCKLQEKLPSKEIIQKYFKGLTLEFLEDWVSIKIKNYLYKLRRDLPDMLNFKYSYEYMFYDFKKNIEASEEEFS